LILKSVIVAVNAVGYCFELLYNGKSLIMEINMHKNIGNLGANEILELVFTYLIEISSLKNYNETLNVLARMASALTQAEYCNIWVVSDDRKTISTKISQEMKADALAIRSEIVKKTIATGEKTIVDDLYKDSKFNYKLDKSSVYGLHSMMVIPMYDNSDTVVGVFELINHQGEHNFFDQSDMERLSLVSRYAALTIMSTKPAQIHENNQKEVVFAIGTINESLSKGREESTKLIYEKLDAVESLKVLGAYGTKSKGYGTSCIYLNNKNVIDAGNLLTPLDAECIELDNIWITHAHLDHIVDIAAVIDNYYVLRDKPLFLVGLAETLQAIKKNFLNDVIWPDFSKIKLSNSDQMSIIYKEIELDITYKLSELETIRAIKTDHTVQSCGYIYTKNEKSVLITQDTNSLKNIIQELNMNCAIHAAVIECSFPNEMEELAIASKHLTPKLLFKQLESLQRENLKIYINHMKPSYLAKITEQIREYRGKMEVTLLKDGDFVYF